MTDALRPIGTEFDRVGHSWVFSTEPLHFMLYTYRVVSHDELALTLSPDAPTVLIETLRCVGVRDLANDDPLVVEWLDTHDELDGYWFPGKARPE